MALELLDAAEFLGPALPEPYVRFELEAQLNRHKLLPKATGKEADKLKTLWLSYQRKLRALVNSGGPQRIFNHVLEPLIEILGYKEFEDSDEVATREGAEIGGTLFRQDDTVLRVWSTSFGEDLDAPNRRGRAYRFSHVRVAHRVLNAKGERIGLVTNGVEIRVLLSDPARPESQIDIKIDSYWKRSREIPDTLRLLIALCQPKGIEVLPKIIEDARLKQTKVTKELRTQARQAIELFLQSVLDNPSNTEKLKAFSDKHQLAKNLWHEGLVIVYRLLFLLKLESTDDSARAFTFASSALWRQSFSPTLALSRFARQIIDEAAETGSLLEDGLRGLFRIFTEGLACPELNVRPLGGALFGEEATPLLSQLKWGERGVASLLDKLLWTPPHRGSTSRERVHYGPLDVEDLGRVYEALLELDPGISEEKMCRLRRSKLEVVVPAAQGERYRPIETAPTDSDEPDDADEDEEDESEESDSRRGGTKVQWIEQIPPRRFYLRVGLGRKATGSFYTPHSFVRFLVQETLGPQIAERSPAENPQPMQILKLKVLDPAMGSGHFLVEACRFLGEKLYEACRLCDEKAIGLQTEADNTKDAKQRVALMLEVAEFRQRVIELPDPDDELLRYLPSRAPEGGETGLSQSRALAICRRLVATHCLYGVDKNPLAVELAKLAVWLESHAEGMPLTFLDHRFVVGDSLTGPFWEKLLCRPFKPSEKIEGLFSQGLNGKFGNALQKALECVTELESSVGISVIEIERKQRVKEKLDRSLLPFRYAAGQWARCVIAGTEDGDEASYINLLERIAEGDTFADRQLGTSEDGIPYDLVFPEVFYPDGQVSCRRGFDAILGNPPWDQLEVAEDEFWAYYNIEVLASRDHRVREEVIASLSSDAVAGSAWRQYSKTIDSIISLSRTLFQYQAASVHDSQTTGRPDVWRLFAERSTQLLDTKGILGMLFPSAFHANEGATGIRRLFLWENRLLCCFSFENKRKLFDIHRSFKFALIVASRNGPTDVFPCAFYLHDDAWLFTDRSDDRLLLVTLDDVQRLFGPHLVFVEARNDMSFSIIKALKRHSACDWTSFLAQHDMSFSNGLECHRRPDVAFAAAEEIFVLAWLRLNTGMTIPAETLLLDGKNIHQFQIETNTPVRDIARTERLAQSSHWGVSLRYYRLGFRYVAASTNERTVLACMIPPGIGFANGIVGETKPENRLNAVSLATLSLLNSFTFDYQVRQQATTHVNRYVLAPISVPLLDGRLKFLAHAALLVTAIHPSYSALWREQIGCETGTEVDCPEADYPSLTDESTRWDLRAATDAVVAEAYGLSRDQYSHILSAFSHSSYPQAPVSCLAKFDELKTVGLEAFTVKYDPYWEVPLNEILPDPVVDIPISAQTSGPSQTDLFGNVVAQKNTRRSGRTKTVGEVRSGESTVELSEGTKQ